MATGAFAQGIFTVSPGSEGRGRANGYAEKAGGITAFLTTGAIEANVDAPNDEGTLVISYGVPITNDFGDAPGEEDNVTPPDNNIDVSICMTTRTQLVALTGENAQVAVDQDEGNDHNHSEKHRYLLYTRRANQR